MKTTQDFLSVDKLVALRKQEMARANEEYQRGEVWSIHQKKRLIDSVMRGYQLPTIYLHYRKTEAAGLVREAYDIIDGQQRMNALYEFTEGAFPLYAVEDAQSKFPKFLLNEDCQWGGKTFQSLSADDQTRLREAVIPVAYIETDNDNEVRDLFVRLQSGSPLNAQEKRDTFPGAFTEFILRLGGKPNIARYPGHEFFRRVLRMKPNQDRGKTRQLAAQVAMLFLEREASDLFTDINAKAVDNYYHANLDFDANTSRCKRLVNILDKLNDLLGDGKHPHLRGHDAMHLVLFLDQVWDDYTKSWESMLSPAQSMFSHLLALAAKSSRDGDPDETWLHYGMRTRSNSDRGDNIRRRHRYYAQCMVGLLGNLTPLDPKRAFNSLERELIWQRSNGKCQRPGCQAAVKWEEAEIHHIKPHSEGGETVLENGALVHQHCHPKGQDEVKAFAEGLE